MKAAKRLLLVAALAILPILLLVPPALAFTDVPITHKYAEAIGDLSDREIINGFPDGSFGPAKAITRQQYAKMICLTLGLSPDLSQSYPFTDLDPYTGQPYPNGYIVAAWKDGITTGVTSTSFQPYNNITRAQVITMTMRALEKHYPSKLSAPSVTEHDLYDDDLAPLGVHAPYALLAYSNYLLNDDYDILHYMFWSGDMWDDMRAQYGNPWEPMPRQEVAGFLHNVFYWVIDD